MHELGKLIAEGESDTLEFKPAFNQDVIETAAAFANAQGGRVLIGVSDSGKLRGATFGPEILRDYVNRISNATQPAVIPDVRKIKSAEGEVIILTVQDYPLKPVSVRGRCFKRSGSVTRQMSAAEIAEAHLQCTGQSPDARRVERKTVEDLDLARVKLYMTRAVNSGRRTFSVNDDPLEILRKLELVGSDSEVTRAALLLFGKNPQSPFSQAVIHAGKLRDEVHIMDTRIIRGSLMDQADEALEFIKKHMRVEYVISGKTERDEIWDYPLEALREGLMNAVCHRDYGDLADIQIKIFDDSLQIWSPGFLPFGVTVEELHQSTHSSKPRNRLIAQVFYDMGMIEQYGSGTGRVIKACKAAGLPEPEFSNFSGGFRILFRLRMVVTPPVTPPVAPPVAPPVKMLLLLLEKTGELGASAIRTRLGINDKAHVRNAYIDPALAAELIERTVPDKPNSRLQKYRLTEKGKALLKDGE